MDHSLTVYSQFLFYNGIVNLNLLKDLLCKFKSHKHKKPNKTNMITSTYEVLSFIKNYKLNEITHNIFNKYNEIKEKHILRLIRRIFIIYNLSKKKTLYTTLLKWNTKIIKLNSGKLQETRSDKNSNINNHSNVYNKKIFNKTHIENLYNDAQKRELKDIIIKSNFKSKSDNECTFSPKILSHSQSRINIERPNFFENLDQENNKRIKNLENKITQANLVLEQICTFSPKINKYKKVTPNEGLKQKDELRSHRSMKSEQEFSPKIDHKKQFFDEESYQRINNLHSLHKEKDRKIKRREDEIYKENGYTFRPQISKIIQYNRSSKKEVKKDHSILNINKLNKRNTIDHENLNQKEKKLKSSFSISDIQKSTQINSTNINIKEKFENSDPKFEMSSNNLTKNSFGQSFKCKNSIQEMTKSITVFNNTNENKFKTKNNSNRKLVEIINDKKSTSFKGNNFVNLLTNIETNSMNNIQTDNILNNKKSIINSFNIENLSEKQILELANHYITTDESIEKFSKIHKNTSSWGNDNENHCKKKTVFDSSNMKLINDYPNYSNNISIVIKDSLEN